MKARGVFAVMAAKLAILGHFIKDAFATHGSGNISGRISNGRQAFYAVSAPLRASQKKNYKKGWAK